MNKRTKLVNSLMAAMLGLVIAVTGLADTTFARPAAQTDDPVAMIMALAEAYNNADVAKMQELLDSTFKEVTENPLPGLTLEDATTSREDFIESSRSGLRVTLSNCTMTAPDMASCDLTGVGGNIPPLPHPFMQRTTATVRDGKIILLSNRLSEQTYNDFLVFITAQPGMPTTGSINNWLLFGILALALSIFAIGVLLRRARFILR